MNTKQTWGCMGVLIVLAGSAGSIGCGRGADILDHNGMCDLYPGFSTSSYKLPWAAGATYTVPQGNCESKSHFGFQRYAYDVSMSIGTQILAARAGTVVGLKEDLTDGQGCPDANYVLVQHTDGTVASYVHLTQNGAQVNLGAAVNQGDVVGLSGNTGCSSGPHLHFVVWKDTNLTDSVPVTFNNAGANPRGLLSGNSYTAQ